MRPQSRRRGVLPAIGIGLAVGGVVVLTMGAYTFQDTFSNLMSAKRANESSLVNLVNANTPKEFEKLGENYQQQIAKDLGNLTGQGAQIALNLQMLPAGGLGDAVSNVFTVEDVRQAVVDYGETYRTTPSSGEAALFLLRKRHLESLLARQELPPSPAFVRSLMRSYEQLVNQERSPIGYEEYRKLDPAKYGKLSDEQILEKLGSGRIQQKVLEMRDFVKDTRRQLESRGISLSPEMLEELLEIRFSKGKPAFDAALTEKMGLAAGGNYRGKFHGQDIGGVCLIKISGSSVSGYIQGTQSVDKQYPAQVMCNIVSGSYDPQAGSFQASLEGQTTIQFFSQPPQVIPVNAIVKGTVNGSRLTGRWQARYSLGGPKITLEGDLEAQR